MRESPRGRCIQEIFQAQVQQSPDAPAITFGATQLTYGQLNERANQLAHYVKACGVGPEVPVALFLERSPEMVVAILAVLKAGGIYVPIDLAYPKERANFMMEDIRAPLLVTQDTLRSRMPETNSRMICLDSDRETIARQPVDDLPVETNGDNAAYVIYTSGSTGRIKGVVVTHENVTRLFEQTEHWFGFGPSDVWTLFHSYAFDFSVWELWGALFYGGRLVIVPYLVARSPDAFYNLLAEQRVTVLNQTPSAFRQLIWAEAAYEIKRELSLRYVICGGEALESQSLKPWFDRHGDEKPEIINMYGITETTVHVTYRRIWKADLDNGLGSVIGFPIPDLEIHLLDDDLKLVSAGVPGEICVGGAGVARGYWNRPDLTARRFVPDPFSDKPGARLYRSGDLAQYSACGELEYLGRLDHQVKIRGFRIELGEIESVLNRHPAVRESIVLLHESNTGEKRLVAYVVPAKVCNADIPVGETSGQVAFLKRACQWPTGMSALQGSELPAAMSATQPTVSDLRAHLGQTIPDYMIPATFVFLESLPLTTNGKVDRRALPKPQAARPALNQEFRAPETPVEKILAKIWSEVLEVEQVGVDDNFFELGGDSIRSIVILSKAQQHGLKLSLEQIFQYPTVSALAACATNADPKAPRQSAQPFSFVAPEDCDKLPAGLEDAYPLARLQLGMFFHNEFDPESAVYHDVFSFRLHAPFEFEKLQFAANRLIERHAILRTSFHLAEFSEPLQLVHRHAEAPFTTEDLRGATEPQQEEEIKRWIAAERRNPFERTVPPLVRFHSQRLTDESFQFLISFHHACLDGWSLAAVVTELFKEYFSLLHENDAKVHALSSCYRDFVALEQKAIASKASRDFWIDKLKDTTLQLLPRWPKSFCAGGREQVRGPEIFVKPEVLQGLKKIAQTAGTPLKSVLLAAHQRVMALLYGQTDVVSGLAFNGRPEAVDADRLPGLFLNTIPLRMQLNGGTWLDLIKQSFAAEQELIPHRRFPLSEIQKLYGRRRLFEAAFDFVHFHVFKNLHGHPNFRFVESHYAEANDLTFFANFILDVNSTQLELHIDYDPNELCREQIEQITQYYIETLQAIAAQPSSRFENFSPVSESERERILVEWNATASDYPRSRCIHQLFEERVANMPEAPSLTFGRQHLTYSQLNAQANRLARYLQRQAELRPDVPVALCMESSLNMVVGILAILKTGAAYAPLDPAYPKQRLAFMFEDTQSPLLLSERAVLPRLPEFSAKIICVDDERESIDRESAENLSNFASPENLAYVMYTSGSTGQPKGVAVPHRAVNRLVLNTNYIHLDELDRVAQVSNFSFDAATFEIWGALLNGGQLIGISKEIVLSPKDFARELREEGITAMFLTAALFNQTVAEAPDAFASLRTLIVGGEALDPKSVRAVLKQHPPQRLLNGYGPTENTTFTCCHHVRELPDDANNVPIGRPISNTQVYILDAHLNPVPVGVAGQLYVGGDGLARGYWNRPELTAEKFIPNPFSPPSSHQTLMHMHQSLVSLPQSLYQTGDLARYLPDGNIQFFGRIDGQVKLRGFRIELGEIESALNQHPAIRESAVTVAESASGEKRLVAYIVPAGPIPTIKELHKFLALRLPDYMLPAIVAPLDALPLTANGKLDRRALPRSGETHPDLCEEIIPPRDSVETKMVELWEKLLDIRPIGIADNFFHLGGHSLLAVRLSAQVERTFGRKLPLALVYQSPTIEQLAPALRNGESEISVGASGSIVPIQTGGTRPPLFLVHGAGGGMFWGYVNLSRHLGSEQPVYGFRSRGLDGREEFARLEDLASSYLADLRNFQPRGPYYLGGYCFGGNVAHEMARQLSAQGERVAFLALLNCVPPKSGYTRIPWTPFWAVRFMRNLFYWLKYFRHWSPKQRREFFRWKMGSLRRRLARLTTSTSDQLTRVEPGDLVDLSSYSPEQRKLWETHIRALLAYHPRPYPGAAHLFRSPVHPFRCSFAPDYGWSGLAEGGIQTIIVPGAHEQILEEPYVQILAREIQQALSNVETCFQPAPFIEAAPRILPSSELASISVD